MPPLTITNVIPKASTAVTDACTPTLRRLFVVRKSPDSSASSTTKATRAASGPPVPRTDVTHRHSAPREDGGGLPAADVPARAGSVLFSGTALILP